MLKFFSPFDSCVFFDSKFVCLHSEGADNRIALLSRIFISLFLRLVQICGSLFFPHFFPYPLTSIMFV